MDGLILSKFLYSKAVKESYQKGIPSKISILTFHDSVEMFLYMALLHNKNTSSQRGFMRFWKDFPLLTHKNEMDSFNTIRNKLKHEGIEPSSKSVVDSRNDVFEFYQANAKNLFDTEYSEITLTSLIRFSEVKNLMKESESHLLSKEYSNSVECTAKAFYQSLYLHKNLVRGFFFRKSDMRDFHQMTKRVRGNLVVNDFSETKEREMEDELSIIQSLVVDPRRYFKFKNNVIEIIRFGDDRLEVVKKKEPITEVDAEDCFNFVIDVILSVQEYE